MSTENEPQNHHHVVIMAGGSGTRFWPASRASKPKQLLPLAPGGEVMLTATVRRALATVESPEHVWIVSSERLRDATRAAASLLPESQFLDEPVGRNTAPCVGWAAAEIAARDRNAVIAVLPADHHIQDEAGYSATLHRGLKAASGGAMVTVGIAPTRPETGYGYIQLADELAPDVFRAKRFVEKPDAARAQTFLDAGTFLWNSGMFFFRADSILEQVAAHIPELSTALAVYFDGTELPLAREQLTRAFAELPSVSIDHGIMEKADAIQVVRGDFGWSDLGSWLSAWELGEQDSDGNVLPDNALALDSSGSLVAAPAEKLVCLLGVENLVVIQTDDAILVTTKERSQDVRNVVEALRHRGQGKWL